MTTQSESHFTEAQHYIPGGVNSPVRAFKAVGGAPVFFKRGKGAFVYDEDDNAYIDYVGSWGPLILGHAHPDVIQAVQNAAADGLGFGAPTVRETTLAKMICEAMPSIERVRLVNSGTEATMSALRLARAFTARNKIIKFTGCYHGHCDSLLVKAGSGLLTLGIPNTPGVPEDLVQHTLCATFNDLDSVTAYFEQYADDIACIIVEPVAGNMNCVPSTQTFLQGLRELCDRYNSVLIFDEVMTGFRVAQGGAQSHYNITPDLTTLGKVIGGGLPVGAFGGQKDIMNMMAPEGPVYQAGTLSGNPLAVTAGIATLKLLEKPEFYTQLSEKTKTLAQGLKSAAQSHNIPFTVNYTGGMFGFFFTEKEHITQYNDVMQCDIERFKLFFHEMLKRGVYFAPSAFEAGFVSSAHDDEIIQTTLEHADKAFEALLSIMRR